jgi:hypothetical protein
MTIIPAYARWLGRGNSFSHRLKDKRERSSDNPAEMTADQMKVAEKMYYDVDRGIGNLSCVIRDPSPEQGEMMDEWINQLKERLETSGTSGRNYNVINRLPRNHQEWPLRPLLTAWGSRRRRCRNRWWGYVIGRHLNKPVVTFGNHD